jgi:hypothetical protein
MSYSIGTHYKNVIKKYSSGMNEDRTEFRNYMEKRMILEHRIPNQRIVYALLDLNEVKKLNNRFILINVCRTVLFKGNFCPGGVSRKILGIGNELLILLFSELFSIKYRKDYIKVFHRELLLKRKFFHLIDEIEEIMSNYYNGFIVLRRRMKETQMLNLYYQNSDEIIPQEDLRILPPIGGQRDNVDKIIERMINWIPLI